MAGAHQEALGLSLGDPEGQHRRAAPGDIILAAGDQLPLVFFLQAGVSGLVQFIYQIGLGVVDAVGSVQEGPQAVDSFIHD